MKIYHNRIYLSTAVGNEHDSFAGSTSIFCISVCQTRYYVDHLLSLCHFRKKRIIYSGEEYIGIKVLPYVCNIEFPHKRYKFLIYGSSTDDERLLFVAYHIEDGGDTVCHLGTGIAEGCVMGDDDVAAFGERTTRKGTPSIASHDDGMARGERLESLEVVGDMPQEVVVLADSVVLGYGDNDGKVGDLTIVKHVFIIRKKG